MNNKILIAIIAILVLGGGYYFLTQKDQPADSNTQTEQSSSDKNDTQLTELDDPSGTITGSLSYPSEGIPEEMQVCAETTDKSEMYCSDAQLSGPEYKYGKGYAITVPPGKYYVFATLSPDPNAPKAERAYYNEFVECGLSVDCKDTTNITVTVESGETVKDINPWDWYNN